MPWHGSTACSYDQASIARSAPTRSGVYVILSLGRWLYVGESGSIRGSLALQFAGVNPCIAAHEPTHFMYELVPDADRAARRRELILEFPSVCNPCERA
jgi:excinuclease UvrABC nuclease subunit